MMTTGAAITEILEAYGNRQGQWVRIAEIADKTGLTKQELTEAFEELLACAEFQVEPAPFPGQQLTARDREIAPVIAEEARHFFCWGA